MKLGALSFVLCLSVKPGFIDSNKQLELEEQSTKSKEER
jgi:hypothetical protein